MKTTLSIALLLAAALAAAVTNPPHEKPLPRATCLRQCAGLIQRCESLPECDRRLRGFPSSEPAPGPLPKTTSARRIVQLFPETVRLLRALQPLRIDPAMPGHSSPRLLAIC